eukprot:CAMPEP_0116878380 /NCGR_PEP_ID=MMETSP0463-20121206/10132_1 /TAXON_ID=181622 /ORGANISM="Strombidinopsis sp, Strain SopsisLIS2011" /LENGTH=31 /DNA_ID= /DNA_START= /DNA_END= /DNA_ORIENTATION=
MALEYYLDVVDQPDLSSDEDEDEEEEDDRSK